MNEAEYQAEVQRWLKYVQEDLRAAESFLGQPSVAPRHICFLSQQSVEKCLKSVLIFEQVDFPYRHDLDQLRNLIPVDWQIREDYPDLAELTEWAVESRYPGNWVDPTDEDARIAVEQARGVWESIRRDFLQRGFEVVALAPP